MMNVNRYSLKCLTCKDEIYVWDTQPPKYCTVNRQHLIDPKSISIIESTTMNSTPNKKISKNSNYCSQGFLFDVPAGVNEITYYDVSIPYTINIANIIVQQIKPLCEDVINVFTSPNITIGKITAPVKINDAVLNVDESTVNNITVGHFIRLNDNKNTESLGQVIEVSETDILVTTASTQNFENLETTLIQTSTPLILNYNILTDQPIVFHYNKVGYIYLTANTTIRISYQNTNGEKNKVAFTLEYYY